MVLDEMTKTTYQQHSALDLLLLSTDKAFQWGSFSQQDAAVTMVLDEMTKTTETTETTCQRDSDPDSQDLFLDSPLQQNATTMEWDETTGTMCQQDSDLGLSTNKVCQWDSSLQQNAAAMAQDKTTETTYQQHPDLDLLLLSIDKAFQ
ncbi:MAG: hypothetical protein M1840_005640 [Geoglossum simile]|nr:MAG: hypothetical protein M1840_005640 [Geoglossum simile]